MKVNNISAFISKGSYYFNQINLPHLRQQFQRDYEWPFTHENKWMAVQCTPKYNPVCLTRNKDLDKITA